MKKSFFLSRWSSVFVATSLIVGAGCSQLSSIQQAKQESKETLDPVVQQELDEKNQEKDVSRDPSRIVGSSRIKRGLSTQGHRTYFLYGAEHLGLDNYYFDIPVVYNDAVKKWMNYFLNRGRGFFERYSARAGRYAPMMGDILEAHGLPRDLIFLAMAESGFQNTAKSWARAVGPWQFMPYTGKRYGLHIDFFVDERRDPIKATIAAARYLKELYRRFEAWELAAAAYNAGEGKLSRAIKRYKTENFWKIREGRYLKSETKNYVPKIMALAIIGKNLKSFGFEDIDFHEVLNFEEIDIPGNTDLYLLSEAMEIEFEEIKRLNPELMRWQTPPGLASYKLRVPVGKKETWVKIAPEAKALQAVAYQTYKIRGSRSQLKDVARKFKLKANALELLNGMSGNAHVKRGSLVLLPFHATHNRRSSMYADLYEKPRKSVVRRRKYSKRIRIAKRRGRKITNPSRFYTVQKGDTLWDVARKNNVSLDTLIVSNLDVVGKRMIRAGDRLVVQ